MLEIRCRNGHRVVCTDDRAGTSVACPHCGVEVEVSGRAAMQAAFLGATNGSQGPDSARLSGEETIVEKFAFHCPNGHRLTGPVNIQGLERSCPECGAAFRVPEIRPQVAIANTPVEIDEEDVLSTAPANGAPASDTYSDICLDAIDEEDALSGDDVVTVEPHVVLPGEASATRLALDVPPIGINPMTEVFARLWRLRDEQAVIRVYLRDGGSLAIDGWAEAQSNGSYALFTCLQENGKHAVEVVPWESIERISATDLDERPSGWFD